MNWNEKLFKENEKPLDSLVSGYSHTSVFRTIAFVGDSMSSGEFETLDENGTKGYHDFLGYSWGQHIARKNGLKAYSFSRGGMTAGEYMESFAQEKGFWDPAKAAQAYVIALGANDMNKTELPIGSIQDIKENYRENEKTFVGYYAAIVARYKEISPDAKFFFVTLPNEPERNRNPRAQLIANELYSLAEHFENSAVIDLGKYGPVFDDKFKERYFMYGHMNPSGYILVAEMVDSYIDYIVRHNPKAFEKVAFINSPEKDWEFIK